MHQETLATSVVRSYLGLDPTTGALDAGAEALASAVTSYAVRTGPPPYSVKNLKGIPRTFSTARQPIGKYIYLLPRGAIYNRTKYVY